MRVEIAAFSIALTAIIAVVAGLWAISKVIMAQFAALGIEIKANNESTMKTLRQLEINEAVQATRLDAHESIIKLFFPTAPLNGGVSSSQISPS